MAVGAKQEHETFDYSNHNLSKHVAKAVVLTCAAT